MTSDHQLLKVKVKEEKSLFDLQFSQNILVFLKNLLYGATSVEENAKLLNLDTPAHFYKGSSKIHRMRIQ